MSDLRVKFVRPKPGKRAPRHTTVSATCPDCGQTFSYTFTDNGITSNDPDRHPAPKPEAVVQP